ncbi:MAG: YbhB/YbcL family Raf kinase inhibitor-like protein [Candidatus Omnitrophica bacterium]|nr:YbhB/YbcL family Raf kinase inhibitor-like protein [Candidatus Omnitrophota bacterium]
MKLTSPDFKNNQQIPEKFSCDGKDVNPTLIIEDLPEGTKTLALIVDDPDAPAGTWIHWVVFNIRPTGKIEEDSIPGIQGRNDFKKLNYGGPCPPAGTHRYFFKLYALSSKLELEEGATKEELEEVMQDTLIDKAELMGVYPKN